jgi:hypothetical protein
VIFEKTLDASERKREKAFVSEEKCAEKREFREFPFL